MLASSPVARARRTLFALIPLVAAAAVLATPLCSAADEQGMTAQTIPLRPTSVAVRTIPPLQSPVARSVLRQVRTAPFTMRHDSPILLQASTVMRLSDSQKQEIKATYRAGYSIVLLGASMMHINTLHTLIGEGVSFRSKDLSSVMAYTLRRVNYVPTATLVTESDASPLQTPAGDPDLTGLQDEQMALSRAVARTVMELTRPAQTGDAGPPRDVGLPLDWLSVPVHAVTFAINSPQGIYNTGINVYALYSCIDQTDHYAITAEADWTATNAKWQGATSEDPNPSMYLDGSDNLVINWQDGRTYCSSGGAFAAFDDVCRYINYPLSYALTMIPRSEAPVVQRNAAPGATQGQSTSYTSGFSLSIGGTVNVSGMGPGAGISVGASWNNMTQTSVPPLIVDVGNPGKPQNEGVGWTFKYCTTGLEPDPGTPCTGHVQMVKDVCQAQLGDDSGTNPQNGQTPTGKFSNAVQSAHWQQDTSLRQGNTFDIEVGFTANTANTIAHLNLNGYPDPIQGCNPFNCGCVSVTTPNPVSKSVTFQIPYPVAKCN